MKREIEELINLGTKEVNSYIASAYLLEAIAKMTYYNTFKEKVTDEVVVDEKDDNPESTNL